jgi:hypothetical protein
MEMNLPIDPSGHFPAVVLVNRQQQYNIRERIG